SENRPASPLPPTHSLRILIVDDNHVNLSVLSTLLKRRFGHVLARPPVSLDSGLKALQTLRTEIFDLIFIDIEMPYLDGVECTRRIRAGEDGILAANRNAHIVAVTTNTGDEPAALYRHVGMDGMISKPVRFHQFRQYLCPLSIEAQAAQGCVTPIMVGDDSVMPPMPPIRLDERLFFTPAETGSIAMLHRSAGHTEAQYSDDNDFAAMLKKQTSKSLRDRKAMSIARTGTVSEHRRSSFNSPRSEHLPAVRQSEQHVHHHPDNTASFEQLVDWETDSQQRQRDAATEAVSAKVLRTTSLVRPVPIHRVSSPAYMLDASPVARLRDEPAMRSNPDLVKTRPSIRPLGDSLEARHASRSTGFSSSGLSGLMTPALSSAWSSTRTSGVSSGSTDLLSLSQRATSPSSTLTTPVSSPAEIEGMEDAFAKAVFSPCADDQL
ncbi:hypothetical protein BCV70DRAFT_141139, partial [Testicularia cyperi]